MENTLPTLRRRPGREPRAMRPHRAHRDRRRLAALRRFHGHGPAPAGAGLLRRRLAQVRRGRAISSPRRSSRRCSARHWPPDRRRSCRLAGADFAGSRRRQRPAGGRLAAGARSARRPARAVRSSNSRANCARASRTTFASRSAASGRPRRRGSMPCRNSSPAASSPTSCSTPCRPMPWPGAKQDLMERGVAADERALRLGRAAGDGAWREAMAATAGRSAPYAGEIGLAARPG